MLPWQVVAGDELAAAMHELQVHAGRPPTIDSHAGWGGGWWSVGARNTADRLARRWCEDRAQHRGCGGEPTTQHTDATSCGDTAAGGSACFGGAANAGGTAPRKSCTAGGSTAAATAGAISTTAASKCSAAIIASGPVRQDRHVYGLHVNRAHFIDIA